jgi:hypothetical protein
VSGLVAASTAGNVALEKQSHPERFCPFPRCLWRTAKLDHTIGLRGPGGLCPGHRPGRTVRLAESSGTEILEPISHMTPAIPNAKTPFTVTELP